MKKIILLILISFIYSCDYHTRTEYIDPLYTTKLEFNNLKKGDTIYYRNQIKEYSIFDKIIDDTIYYHFNGIIGNKIYSNTGRIMYYHFYIKK